MVCCGLLNVERMIGIHLKKSERGDGMTKEQIEALQDAWFLMRDVKDEILDKSFRRDMVAHAELMNIMKRLHDLIDNELEKGVAA